MPLSPIHLGETLDRWSLETTASITESSSVILVGGLTYDKAIALFKLALSTGYDCTCVNSADIPTSIEEIDELSQPYISTIDKGVSDSIRFITRVGFRKALREANVSGLWQLPFCQVPFSTNMDSFHPLGGGDVFSVSPEVKSPRELVREYSDHRNVPADIRRWILRSSISEDLWNDAAFQDFVEVSSIPLAMAISSEVPDSRSVVFFGPPRISVRIGSSAVIEAQKEGYSNLQRAAKWVYEDSSAAEQRHVLLSSELARTVVNTETSAWTIFRTSGDSMLESARLAYQLSLSKLSQDAIKAQGELRKNVVEDISKTIEQTRTISTATLVAVATSITAISARLTSSLDPIVAFLVLLVGAVYLYIIASTSHKFVSVQNELRDQWRVRFYRFISDDDYDKMVIKPAHRAQNAYDKVRFSAYLIAGLILVIGLTNLIDKNSLCGAIYGCTISPVPPSVPKP